LRLPSGFVTLFYVDMILRHKLSLGLGVAVCSLIAPAAAQMVQPIPGVTAPDPLSMLSVHLRTLAANPRNLSALLGAGQAAIDVGDPNAALGFFERAEEIDARNPRAKAGLASALVLLEKPDDALRVFGEAVSLGIAEDVIAKDRGLAYDLRGDSRRAQRDYVTALKRGPDDEVTRRYALSLGISGDRSQALTLLDPLLRKQDQGAWRARAFILAMNNDVSGANEIARQVMPASLAGTMSPFLSRLAKLNSAERAHAVNFGTMPSDGQTFASVQIGDPFKPIGSPAASSNAGDGLIPSGAPLGRQSIAAAPAPRELARPKPVTTAAAPPAATPGFTTEPSPRLGTRIGTRIAAVDPTKLPPEARGEGGIVTLKSTMTPLPPPDTVRPSVPVSAPAASVVAPAVSRAPLVGTPLSAPNTASPKSLTSPAVQVPLSSAPIAVPPMPAQNAASEPVGSVAASTTSMTTNSPLPPAPITETDPGVALPGSAFVGPPADPAATPPAAFEVPPAQATPIVTPAAVTAGRLASILSGIEPEAESAPVILPTAAEIRATQRAAARKAAAATEAAEAAQLAKDEKAKVAAAAKANPARLWVQVATGSNARGLTTTWRKIREANDKLLKPYGGYSVPFRATNRVLAGPVRSSADARALVTALGKAGVSATTYSSEAGQEVLKLSAK
jgi:Flp pilus assembly protein TadD